MKLATYLALTAVVSANIVVDIDNRALERQDRAFQDWADDEGNTPQAQQLGAEIAQQADSASKKIAAHQHKVTVPAVKNLKALVKFLSPSDENCSENAFAECLINSHFDLEHGDPYSS